MFSQGFLGISMLLAFLISVVARIARHRDAFSATVSIVMSMFIFEMFVYDQVPISFFVLALAIGFVWRSQIMHESNPSLIETKA